MPSLLLTGRVLVFMPEARKAHNRDQFSRFGPDQFDMPSRSLRFFHPSLRKHTVQTA